MHNILSESAGSMKIFFQIALFFFYLPLFGAPDLTIVGFLESEGGIGKVAVTIIETLGDNVSINLIPTDLQGPLNHAVPESSLNAFNNPDKTPGKVALLTDLIWAGRRHPHELVPKECLIKLAYSMFETTRIPSKWVKILNKEFDAVVVPDQNLVELYENCGVKIPIFVLPIPMILDTYYEHSVHPETASTPFIFGDASANKNPAVLIEAFAKAFKNSPDVHLVMRAGRIFSETRDTFNHLTTKYGLTTVSIEEGHIYLNEYIDRLASFDCYVNLSRGEGFSFIPREALALGIPVITTNNTASKTICDSGFIRAVQTNKKGNPSPHYRGLFKDECGFQFDCEVDDAAAALRDVYDNYGKYSQLARMGREWVEQYNCTNSELQNHYLTLIKPKQVKLGEVNRITNGTLITNSSKLYKKYQQIAL